MAQKYCLKKISKNEYENLMPAATRNERSVSINNICMSYFNGYIVFKKTTVKKDILHETFFMVSYEDGDSRLDSVFNEEFEHFYRDSVHSKYIYKLETQKINLGLHYYGIIHRDFFGIYINFDIYIIEINGVFYKLDFNEYENSVKEKVVLVEPQPFTETKSIPNDRKPIPVTTHSITTSVSTHKNAPTFLNDFDGLKEVIKIFKKISPEDREKVFLSAAELLDIPIELSCKNIDINQI